MSETRGQFDAGIRILKGWIHMPEPDMTEIHNAIRVLEAAGKVDKIRAAQALSNMENIGNFFPDGWEVPLGFEQLCNQNIESANEIRALLEALPDKETK